MDTDQQRRSSRGFAVVSRSEPNLIRTLAPAAEAAGYQTFWVNDSVDADGLAALAVAAEATSSIQLGVGAIPLDRMAPDQIATQIDELGLPVTRLTVGVGSGGGAGALTRVRTGVAALRALTNARIVVAALGPRMSGLAGEIADGVLFDWHTPGSCAGSARIVRDAALAAGRPAPAIAAYVFTALGSRGIVQLRGEVAHYSAYPSYAAQLARMGAAPMETVVAATDREALDRGLAAFDAGLDETAVRAVAGEETSEAYLTLLAAAAPGAPETTGISRRTGGPDEP